MKYAIYKPNSKNTGNAAAFQMAEDKKGGGTIMFINAIQQASWDDSRKIGSFSANAKNPDKSCAVMFNLTECGTMLYAFNSRTPVKFYHKTESRTVSIALNPWDKEAKMKIRGTDITVPVYAFGLSISVDGTKNFNIPLEPGEIENIKALITQGLLRHYGKEETYEQRSQVRDDVQEESPLSE